MLVFGPHELEESTCFVRLEMGWAEQVVAPALAQTMKASAQELGWRFVDSHVPSVDGHGYCADDNWIERIPQSIEGQVRPSLGSPAEVASNAVRMRPARGPGSHSR